MTSPSSRSPSPRPPAGQDRAQTGSPVIERELFAAGQESPPPAAQLEESPLEGEQLSVFGRYHVPVYSQTPVRQKYHDVDDTPHDTRVARYNAQKREREAAAAVTATNNDSFAVTNFRANNPGILPSPSTLKPAQAQIPKKDEGISSITIGIGNL